MKVAKDFLPGITHHFYFIRKGLYKGIEKNSSEMSGVLLDFGCGQKPYKSLFNVERYIGLDFENPGHDHKNESIDVFYDGKNIPFEDEYFDCILCSEVFEHVFDIDHTLHELFRVLKKDGKILITCPFVWNEHEVPHDYARYTVFALKHLLTKHGFDIVNFEKSGSFVEAITQIRILYFIHTFSSFLTRFPGGRYVNSGVIAFINLCGIFRNFFLPKTGGFYLSNICLAKKTNSIH